MGVQDEGLRGVLAGSSASYAVSFFVVLTVLADKKVDSGGLIRRQSIKLQRLFTADAVKTYE